MRQLQGVGDPTLGEWREWSGRAFHLRRRLSAREQRSVGQAVDVRGTPEAVRRAQALGDLLAYAPREVLADEVGVEFFGKIDTSRGGDRWASRRTSSADSRSFRL